MQTITKPEVREVEQEDIEQVSRIEQASFKDPYPSYFLSQLARDNPDTFLVLTLDNEIVGYGVIDHWEDHDHLISIAIDPGHRMKGLGEKLLKDLEERRSKGRDLKLEVRQSNQAAIRLYAKMGFVKTGIVEGYYTDGEDAILMEKTPVKEELVVDLGSFDAE
ncbi:MAG TPA: ribosomal protein S18-alanine N-acetyltransferase [Candidatus Bathyarchaeia archaeon]|nr:ribosomal protein S18-alanine N-acetyltransferase [Candidatus Bathyarchaeia archaeon]